MPCRLAETSGMEAEAEASSATPVSITERHHIPQKVSPNDKSNEVLTQCKCVYMQTPWYTETAYEERCHE